MRFFLPILAALWLTIGAVVLFRVAAPPAAPTPVLERGAVAFPASVTLSEPPVTAPVQPREPVALAPELYTPEPMPEPREARLGEPPAIPEWEPIQKKRKTRKVKVKRQPEAEPSESAPEAAMEPATAAPPMGEKGFCLSCGEPVDSWVEVDGRRQGYCPKHVSKVKVGKSAYAPAPGGAQANDEGEEEGPAAVRCRSRTRVGTQCRRKTRAVSGLCYQHRLARR